MESSEKHFFKRFNVIHGMVFLFIIAAVVLIAVTLMNVFRKNPYGNELVIDNIGSFYGDLPQYKKDQLFHELYETVLENFEGNEEDIPKNGALVREGTTTNEYDEETDVHYGRFVVDIEKIRQSYEVQFEWSNKSNNTNISGYSALVTCIPDSLAIYETNKVCNDSFSKSVVWKNDYQIAYSFGAKTGNEVVLIINSLLSEKKVTTITLDETSFKPIGGETMPAYSFNIETDSGKFLVLVKTDSGYGKDYTAVLVSGNDYIVGGVISGDEEKIAIASNWLREKSNNSDLKITIKNK